MSLDKNIPMGLKIKHFLILNVCWYLIFSIIYWDFDCSKWWLIQNVWGRVILVVLELTFINSVIKIKEGKNE